jgi:hypothetical protein
VRHEWLELHLFESVEQASYSPRNDLGNTLTNGLAQQMDACRQDICRVRLNPQLLTAVINWGITPRSQIHLTLL